MTEAFLPLLLEGLCLFCSLVFFWSTFVVLIGLLKSPQRHPVSEKKLRFAVLICARNEEDVIRLPVKSVLMSKYPAACREVIVLADNCTDETVARARVAGATVWEKTTPSGGKGDVLAWGIARVRQEGRFDAVAVFDADNIVSDVWFDVVNEALNDGESIVTGCRHASNAAANTISGWYAVYWNIMNELSNRVRTNLGLSGKLTGTGFAFSLSVLGEAGWKTRTLVEDVEFTIKSNLAGYRVAYVPDAHYADEQPTNARDMWRQLRRWATGGWQVVGHYFWSWVKTVLRAPSFRLFDSFFAILTGMSVAFVHLFNLVALPIKIMRGVSPHDATVFFLSVVLFVFVMGWVMAIASVALSQPKRRPRFLSVVTFPIFSLILSGSVLYTLLIPTRRWKPIRHTGSGQ